MRIQQRITEPCELLDDNGLLTTPGYATQAFWRYDRNKIKAGWHRIKEWDYYAILAPEGGFGITFTVADLGYIGMAAVCWLDFKEKSCRQVDTMSILPKGKLGFPSTPDLGGVSFKDKKLSLKYSKSGPERVIQVDVPGYTGLQGERGLKGELVLFQDPVMDSMVIATSWAENRRAFYYNQKTNCMPARGLITLGNKRYEFDPKSCFGVLDWGRGYWTYKNRWYWGSASSLLDGHPFGWNIGYGFSDRTPATENMLFYKNKAHKLEDVTFHLNTDDYLAPWQFTSSDGRFEMDFRPLIDRRSETAVLFIKSIQHQVFGTFTGKAVLDDGTTLQIKNFLGFAEDVLNWW
ncbi:MAG: DUF2804 domain-containing protein [Deltaproteobacteria bacterium]|nr:DUF2804 domain-containing protein [Deltaproteobacteria bacterium]